MFYLTTRRQHPRLNRHDTEEQESLLRLAPADSTNNTAPSYNDKSLFLAIGDPVCRTFRYAATGERRVAVFGLLQLFNFMTTVFQPDECSVIELWTLISLPRENMKNGLDTLIDRYENTAMII